MERQRFNEVLLEALREFAREGYTSEARLQDWLMRLHVALDAELPTDDYARKQIDAALRRVFDRAVNVRGIQRMVPGAQRFTLDRVAPELRAELDRRIFAGADLIRLNREAAIQKTLQRFSGWVTSVPPGGVPAPKVREARNEIVKPARRVRYEARRVAIDQGHKLNAAISHTVAMGEGAIAAIWHDRGQYDHGYNARPEHLKRSGKVFLIRGNWAVEKGLVRRGALDYTDSIEQPAELVYCSCWYEYVTTPHGLPEAVLTAKGRAYVAGARQDSLADPVAVRTRRFQGLDLVIETARGETRFGQADDGTPWRTTMRADYGYIRRTVGADEEQVDCYLGDDPAAPFVWVIDQVDPRSRRFDEHKIILGFPTEAAALDCYVAHFDDGLGAARIGRVRRMTVDQLRAHPVLTAAA